MKDDYSFAAKDTKRRSACSLTVVQSLCCFSDSEHDVRSGVRPAASNRGAGQEDRGSGRETGFHPSRSAVTASCAVSSNSKTAKRFPG